MSKNLWRRYNWCSSKVHFRANVIAYRFTLARKCTFDGHQLYYLQKTSSVAYDIPNRRDTDIDMSHAMCCILYDASKAHIKTKV